MKNNLWHISRQNSGFKGKAISVHEGKKQTLQAKIPLSPLVSWTHTHTHQHNSHLKKPQGFIFYKSSINGKVNVAVNKTKLLNCNLASSLWAYCIIFLHQQVTIKFEFVGSFLVSFTMQPGSLSFCFNANAMPSRGTS